MAWSKLTDMEMDDEDQIEMAIPSMDPPKYPWGLRITLSHRELEKLGLEADCDVGDVIDLRAFAAVTSVSKNETEHGCECRIELQIQKLAIENEADE